MHPKKKYIVQLCEVSEEVLHKNKQEKSAGIYRDSDRICR